MSGCMPVKVLSGSSITRGRWLVWSHQQSASLLVLTQASMAKRAQQSWCQQHDSGAHCEPSAHIGQQLLCLHEMALLPQDGCDPIGRIDIARILVQHLNLASQISVGFQRTDSHVKCWMGMAGVI